MSAQSMSAIIPTQYSVYIPCVKVKFSIQVITQILSEYGLIERIDSVNRKNFTTKEIDPNYKRIYVHFTYLYGDNSMVYHMMEDISNNGSYQLEVEPEEVWVMYKATNKIPYTEMNVHQIAHTVNIVDDKVIDLDHEVFCQNARVEQLENTVAELQATIIEMQRHLMLLSESR